MLFVPHFNNMKIISIGEILWDVIGSEEHLGGAPFNFAAHATKLGHTVSFVSTVGDDERGRRALERMQSLGLTTRTVRRVRHLPTGVVSVALASDGQPRFTIHRPAAYDEPELTPDTMEELTRERPDWIYYGTLAQTSPFVRRLTEMLLDCNREAGVFYDVNLRRGCYTPALVQELATRAGILKLNEEEAAELAVVYSIPSETEEFCRACAARFHLRAVCVTRGAGGCALLAGEDFVEAQGYAVKVADAVGAGDAFSAAFLHGLSAGWPPAEIAGFANRVAALVTSRPGGIPDWTLAEAAAMREGNAGAV